MIARNAKNQLASNCSLQIPKYRVQISVLRPGPKQQQQVQQVQHVVVQQQQLQAVLMPEPVLHQDLEAEFARISQPQRQAVPQPPAAPQHRLYMTVSSVPHSLVGRL